MLTQAGQDLAEAELRRAHQERVIADMIDSPGTRAAAELLLREINRTIASIRTNCDLIATILA